MTESIADFIKKWQSLAIQIAKQAGTFLAKAQNQPQINSDEGRDIKLQADIDSEKMIRSAFEQTGIPIIGEEIGGEPAWLNEGHLCWVVDPLDGTFNYLRNLPASCVSIGLMLGWKCVFGVIHDFNINETFWGGPGLGCFLNDKPLHPKWAFDKAQACLMTGFPASYDFSSTKIQQFIKQVQSFKKIRMNGSAAIALSTVAAGRADAYFEEGTRAWDIAAGAAIVEGAGGYAHIEPIKDAKPFLCNIWAVANPAWINT